MSEENKMEPIGRDADVAASTKSVKLEATRGTIRKFKILSGTNLHNLKQAQIFKYILQLHQRMRKLMRKLEKYKRKLAHRRTPPNKHTVTADAQQPTDSKVAQSFLDEIKEAAQNCSNHTDFVYEPTSGLYYDKKTGYYYNAEHGLYYDGNTGCYYSYNQEESKFEFHSQVYAEESSEKSRDQISESRHSPNGDEDQPKCRDKHDQDGRRETERRQRHKKSKKIERVSRRRERSDSDRSREDGELSDDNQSDDSVVEIHDSTDESRSHESNDSSNHAKYEDIAKKYPPSLRIVVQETNLPKLKIGELFLITYKGGTLGREGQHDVIIPDINCSKFHLRFSYNESKAEYSCIDLGSRNGTILNGKRMSSAQQESSALSLVHGAILQIGRTKLLCHIHDGHTTCGHCEPGLLEIANDVQEAAVAKPIVAGKSIAKAHKEELKKLKKRYGLEEDYYAEPRAHANNRAEQRRKQVGSSSEHEKTQAASTDTSIAKDNKGFKMLAKMGWSQGSALGKNDNGLLEPIPLVSNEGKKGLGCNDGTASIPKDTKSSLKTAIWTKAQERYNEVSQKKIQNIFANSSDSE